MTTDTMKPDISRLRISREHKEQPTPGKSRRRLLIGVPVAIALLAGGYALLRTGQDSVRDVDLATATLTFPSQAGGMLSASGYVVAQQKAAVASKGTGRLEFLGVEEGDRVRRGQVIARLEDDDIEAALARARANLEVARAEYNDAERTLKRTRSLFDRGLASEADLDGSTARFERIRAGIAAAEAAVREAEVALENTRIRAPFDGTVLTKDADVGEIVAPFAASANSRGAVVTIADMSSLQVEADVSESNIMRVTLGQPCEIVLDAYPQKRYRGTVHKIVPTADRAKATVQTKVAFKDRDAHVLPEMSAKVTFLAAEASSEENAPPVLTVPLGAVVDRNGSPVALVVRDGVVQETPVSTGRVLGDRLEVTRGLAEGDRVVLRPTADLASGSTVRQRPQ